jgi:surface protein
MGWMFNSSGMTLGNYDDLLISWASQNVNQNAGLGVAGLKYCKGEQARLSLILNKGWSFLGDEKDCSFTISWKTDNPGTSPNDAIHIPTIGGGYNYDVDWNNDGTFDQFGINGSISYIFPQPGTYTIRIQGDFPRIYFNNAGDKEKLINIDQWGDNEWTSMESAFKGCANMTMTATDSPDLSNLTNLSEMFYHAEIFNGDVSEWDVSSVTNMSYLFWVCDSFDGDLSSWDVSNVTDMSRMFWSNDLFNGNLASWDVSSVENMFEMFRGCLNFNGDLSSWDVSSVDTMRGMFHWTPSFNADLSAWDVSNVTDMANMFQSAEIFNSDLSSWDVSNVTDMSGMFALAHAFNSDISSWNVSNVTNMSRMFRSTYVFNQDIGGWDVSSVTQTWTMFSHSFVFDQDLSTWDVSNVDQMRYMFNEAHAFNQDLSGWDITAVFDIDEMLTNCGLSQDNYDQTLIGWAGQNVMPNLNLGADGLNYCAGKSARDFLTGTKNWNITGDNNVCPPLIMTWQTDNPGSSPDKAISIPTDGDGYNYDVDWNNDGIFDQNGVVGSVSHIFPQPGTYTIRIRGDFPRIFFDDTGDREKLIDIKQWGTIEWTSMENAFKGCENLIVSATDAPNLSNVNNLSSMFYRAEVLNSDLNNWDVSNVDTMELMFAFTDVFNGDISNWDVSNVVNMRSMFNNAKAFNGDLSGWDVSSANNMILMFRDTDDFNSDISNWDVSNVNTMAGMFNGAHTFNNNIGNWDVSNVTDLSSMFVFARDFNQDISQWDVSNVTDIEFMFFGAWDFNQDISSWNVSSVTDMDGVFKSTQSFNQDLSNWDVSNVATMKQMFLSASVYDQDLGGWDVSSVVDMEDMLAECGLSQENYDQTLIGWANQVLQPNVVLDADGLNYCVGESARNSLINNDGWVINGDIKSCLPAFLTTWKTDNPGTSTNTSITIPASGPGLKYHVDWDNDGIYDDINVNSSITHDYGVTGTYTVAISGSLPRIAFNNSGDKEKLLFINQWSDNQWSSMQNAFYGCSNLKITALDLPNLSNVESTGSMFRGATLFNSGINNWDLSNITSTTFMFAEATSFNQNLDSWNMSNVENMSYMFYDASAFDGNITSWDVSNVTNMYGLFWNASSFNQDIGNWNTVAVIDMRKLFESAIDFNQELGNWNIENVTQMNSMLKFSDLDLQNYDNTIIGWASQNVQSNVILGADDLEYCASQIERDNLINDKGWTFNNDILGCAPCGLITWIGAMDNWMTPNLWDLNRIPLPCDHVKINSGGHVILNNENLATILSVTNEGILELKTGSKLEILPN